jgi:multidrug efflux pump subunit AcrA (membrane-fusion protein)
MTASARIRAATAKDVLRVPNAALHFTPIGENAGAHLGVFRIASERLERTDVTTGITDGELTEIRDGSLAENTVVVTDYTPQGKKFYGIGR